MNRLLKVGLLIALVIGLFGAYRYVSAQEGPGAKASALSGAATAGSARQVVLGDLPEFTAPARRTPVVIPLRDGLKGINKPGQQRGVPPSGLAGNPSPSTVAIGTQGTRTDTPGANKVFFGKDEAACGFFIPSDHALATNSAYEVQVLNSCITVFNPGGSVLSGFPKSLNTFFGAPAPDAVGDPRALFDWSNNRWIVLAEDFSANNILVAASKTSNPTGLWNIYTLSGTTGGQLPGCADFPMMGQTVKEIADSKGAIYVSFDRFDPTCSTFVDDVVWILPKTPIYAGAGFGFNFFFNFNLGGATFDHIQPANVMNRGDQPDSEFLVNTYDFNGANSGCFFFPGCNGLWVWAIHQGIGAGASASSSFISTANNYAQPYTAAQPGAPSGTTCAINTGFVGISGGVTWSGGDVYAATTSANFTGSAADGWIYWQVHPSLNTSGALTGLTMRNEVGWGLGGFGGGDTTYGQYYATVQPDDEGNVTVVHNESSDVIYPSTAYLTHRTTLASFPDGGLYLAFGSPPTYCQLDNFGRNRWGDYTATSPFGSSIAPYPEFWFAGQFSESSGNWGTKIGKNGYSNPTAQ